MRERKLECSWPGPVSFDNFEDLKRYKEIGLDRLLDEKIQKQSKIIPKPSPPLVQKKTLKSSLSGSEFLRIARENKGIVTYQQAAIINPKYPNDPAYYAKQLGAQILTERKNKLYKVIKYP